MWRCSNNHVFGSYDVDMEEGMPVCPYCDHSGVYVPPSDTLYPHVVEVVKAIQAARMHKHKVGQAECWRQAIMEETPEDGAAMDEALARATAKYTQAEGYAGRLCLKAGLTMPYLQYQHQIVTF